MRIDRIDVVGQCRWSADRSTLDQSLDQIGDCSLLLLIKLLSSVADDPTVGLLIDPLVLLLLIWSIPNYYERSSSVLLIGAVINQKELEL